VHVPLSVQEIDDLFEWISADPSDENLARIVAKLKQDPDAAAKLGDAATRMRNELIESEASNNDLWSAVFLMGQLGDEEAVPFLKDFAQLPDLTEQNEATRMAEYTAKMQAIGSLGTLEAADELRELLTMKSRLRGSVYVALAELGQPEKGHELVPADEIIGPAPPELAERAREKYQGLEESTPTLDEEKPL
jgi:HEAT repeat protein